MTNGEKIKEIFPNFHINEMSHTVWVGNDVMSFKRDWWNAEYKEPITQELQAKSDKFDAAFQDGYNNGYAQARFDYEQKQTTINDSPKYCDRNICLKNEYNNVGCEDCEVTKSQEPTTKNCELCRYYGSHHEVCNYCYKCSLWTEGEPTTKNDLGVDGCIHKCIDKPNEDCISRAYAIQAMQDKAKKLTNEDTINGLCGAVAILFDLPPVTSQEPKAGHWKLVQRGKEIDVCCSNCGAVRIKGYAYNYTIDELNKEDINECFGSAEMNFCPNCGANMKEVKE